MRNLVQEDEHVETHEVGVCFGCLLLFESVEASVRLPLELYVTQTGLAFSIGRSASAITCWMRYES